MAKPMAEDQEPLLNADDIQGNILPGFSRNQQLFVGFSSQDGDALRRALSFLKPLVTTLATALDHRDDRKQALIAGLPRPQREDLWLSLALGPDATDALGAGKVRGLDGVFDTGMRSPITGDPSTATLPDGTPNPAHRSNWVVGSRLKPLDLLLIFAHDEDVGTEAAPVIEKVAALVGAAPIYQEPGALLPGQVEHFGFRDGISQVGVRGRIQQDGAERILTTRHGVPSRDGIDYGKPGQALVWPGQILTGQPNFAGDAPTLEPEYMNGSFLVFRRLRQNVEHFYDDTAEMAKTISAGTGQAVSPEALRARIVGRYRSGSPLMRHAQAPAVAEGPDEINYFAFGVSVPDILLDDGTPVLGAAADPDVFRSRRCPVWAHIRKVNPRELSTNRGDAGRTLGFQMMRRSIPFGPLYDNAKPDTPSNRTERGLLFVSYQRSIDDHFGLLNRDWMNNDGGPSAGGFDLLVGQNVDGSTGLHAAKTARFFSDPGTAGENGFTFDAPRQWVVPTGGAFLFAPSMTFLEHFAPAAIA